MINTHCNNNDKPGKNEKPMFLRTWMMLKDCPHCDRKRIAVCNDPNCVRRK